MSDPYALSAPLYDAAREHLQREPVADPEAAPPGRRHHRWKTHAGYRSRQCGEGRYVWLPPHDLGFLVDHTGTHRIHPEKVRMMTEQGDSISRA